MRKTTILLPYPVPAIVAMAFKFTPLRYQSNVEIEVINKGAATVELEFELPEGEDVAETKIELYTMMILSAQTLYGQTHSNDELEKIFGELLKWMRDHSPEYKKLSDRGKPGMTTELQKYIHLWIVKAGDLMGMDHRPCWEAKGCTHAEDEDGD